jgi:hypothetical protein
MAMRCGKKRLLAVLTAAVLLAGCATLGKPSKGTADPLSGMKKRSTGVPVKMAAIWSPAVLNRPGEPPMRGFGGRLYFYDAQNQPVAVEGQLMVYAYDDSNPYSNGKTPDRKFAFTPEQFAQHYRPTELGDSYSIWIPWDAVGQPQVEVSLVPILTTTSGQLVMGQPSRALLPGPRTPPTVSRIEHSQLPPPQIRYEPGVAGPWAVQPAAYQTAAAAEAGVPGSGHDASSKPAGGVESLTIPLPGTLADRLAQAGPQQVNPLQQLAMKRAVAAPVAAAGGSAGTTPSLLPAGASANMPASVPPGMLIPGAAGPSQGIMAGAPMAPAAASPSAGLTSGPPRAWPASSPTGSSAAATTPVRPPAAATSSPMAPQALVPQDAP